MRRPWHVWFVFALSVAAMIPALLWLSFRTLGLEREQLLSKAKAAQEENIASVLLRLDSQVAPLLLRETSRPYRHYEATYPFPVTNIVEGKNENIVVAFPSPVVLDPQPDVLLHFEIFEDGEKCCPEATADDLACNEKTRIPPSLIQTYRQRFATILETIDYKTLAHRIQQTPEPNEAEVLANYSWQAKVSNLESQRQQRMYQESPDNQGEGYAQSLEYVTGNQGAGPPQQAAAPNDQQRSRAAYNQTSRTKLPIAPPPQAPIPQVAQMASAPSEIVREGRWEPLWHQEKLFLVRQVQRKRLFSLQVCWLDWESLRPKLLSEARSLIPEANLRPVDTRDPDEKLGHLHLMAALPLSLVISPPVVTQSVFSSTIIMPWAGFFMAALVVALLLYSVISLSERRAAFVTSVTHELRTPLTTFRMYAEMLSEGMVPDEASRRRYLDTLRVEADRLGHLVENVLAYARLERGRAGNARETVDIAPLLHRTVGRLFERANQAGKSLVVERIDKDLEKVAVRTDPGAVEQIVMNLIDNACKYAQPASDARVLISLGRGKKGNGVCIGVRDFGPGIKKTTLQGLFSPFSKTAQEAAVSAPGVGLGLALCRRLARQLGGQLTHRTAEGGGALMELHLP